MTETEREEAKDRLDTLRKTVRKDLATDLGGSPEDYRAEVAFETKPPDPDEALPDGGAEESTQ